MDNRPPYFILVSWLWLAGLLLFMVMVTWHMGLLPEVLAGDQTRISVVLLILTALITLHCAYRSYKLSRLDAELRDWRKRQVYLGSSASKEGSLQQGTVDIEKPFTLTQGVRGESSPLSIYLPLICLLYTSPSPRDS